MLKALKELPKTLDETYDRILLRIPEEYHQDAEIVFCLLAFSPRPISLQEAAEAVAMDLKEMSFDHRDRLQEPRHILKICSSLVTLSPFEPKIWEWQTVSLATADETKELRFAHYSVKEYLVSQRRSSHSFKIHSENAHQIITKLCLIYLLSFRGVLEGRESFRLLPFYQYASQHWHVHAKNIQLVNDVTTLNMISLLFDEAYESNLRNSLRVWNPDKHFQEYTEKFDFAPRIYYASSLGLFELCKLLLVAGADVNAHGGRFGNALQAAPVDGHREVVQQLLTAGADVNAQGGLYGNALQAASLEGHREVVQQQLLTAGADSTP